MQYGDKDALGSMRMEHRFIDSLFQRVRATDDDQPQLLADLAHNITRALARHLFCEEYALYAVDGGVLLQAGWGNGAVVVDEMMKDHFVLKGALYRLQDTTPQDECLRQYVFWLHDRYKRHADREETEVRRLYYCILHWQARSQLFAIYVL